MTTNDLQSLIDAEARRIAAFNASTQEWEECQQDPIPRHRKGHYCEHQVRGLAEHLVRNRVQVEDARRKALVEALERIATFRSAYGESEEAQIAQAALKAEEEAHG